MDGSIDSVKPEDWDRAARAALTAGRWAETGFSLETLNEHLARPFGDVSLVNRCLAFALWQQGHPVEVNVLLVGSDWMRCGAFGSAGGGPFWSLESRYRVLPKPEEFVLPSIDWSHVAPKWKWLSQDKCGDAFLTTARPTVVGREWLEGCDYAEAHGFASYAPGKGDWTKLIVQRPEGA